MDQTTSGVPAEQSALRPAQDFGSCHVEHLHIEGIHAAEIHIVNIDSDRRFQVILKVIL